MSAVIGALRAILSLDTAQFEAGLGKAQAKLAGVSAKISGMSAKMTKIGTAMSLAAAGVTMAVRGQIDAADKMGQLATKMGVPVDELSKLAWAAKLSDVSIDSLSVAMKTLAKNMFNSPKIFEDLGVATKDAGGNMRSVSDVMADVSDIFAKMPDGAEKTALAMKLFGKAGQDMIPMLNNGTAGLKGMMDEAARMGLVITPEMADAANNFNDNLDRLTAIAGGIALQIASVLTPALKSMSDRLIGVSQWFAGLGESQKQWISWVVGIVVAGGPLLIGLGMVTGALSVLTSALATMAAVALANPIILIAAGIAAAALAIWWNWDWLKAKFTDIMAAISRKASEAWGAIKDFVGDTIRAIEFKWAVWRTNMAHFLDTVPKLFSDLWEKVKAVAAQWVDDFLAIGGQIVDGLKKGISDKWDAMVTWFQDKVDGLTEGVRGLLGIHSPSRVFQEIGGFIGQGLQLGIEGSLSGIGSAMKGITDTLEASSAGWKDIFADVGGSLKSAFVGAVTGKQGFGKGLRSGLSGLLSGYADKAAGHAFDAIGKLFGFANGGAFQGGRVMAFANGGIVGGPTLFPMSRGTGLMGEAGPEAIMPLTRGAGGKLGVANHGHISIGFDASTGDLTAAMYDAAGQIVEEKRAGIVRQSVGAVQRGARGSKRFLG